MKVNYLVKSFIFFSSVLLSASAFARDASLSTDTININTDEIGNFTISGNDDGDDNFQFRWDIPSGLNVTKGSSSNLNKFDIDWDKMRIKVESDARGSFSATINVSASNSGTFVLNNTRAEINLNPSDVTIAVGGSSGGTSGGGATTDGGTTDGTTGGTTGSGTADYTLYIESGFVTITASPDSGNGATTIPSWGYTETNGGNGLFPGAILESVEGGSFTVEVVNNLTINHNFVIRGVTSDTTSIPPGGSRTYTVNTPNAGVYLYRDTLNSNINRALGLFGGLVVRTADGSQRAWNNGPRFDQERLWVINDLDRPRWTDRAFNGNSVSTGTYRPNYFFMNGLNGFAGMGDPNSTIEGNVGET
ncbi:MAG: multicopper oxidase domain-containing protein, partial [Gammaproteobacteria bacterium]|nr:multicopper oxidase domain-containing protein [Gammaproteobacteria bacterium]